MNAQGLKDIQSGAGLKDIVNTPPSIFIKDALPWIFGAAGIILLLNIVSAGIKMMTSAGEPKALGAAQAKLTTSLIGILILFASFWIVNLVMQFLGIGFNNGTIIK